mmetsp:Transcript_8250/g.21652  ORF Transcript_8250/g.21652 Transcript_8250/m.21652 type:complete len:202 (-) Transcript_8250:410-1015(-)
MGDDLVRVLLVLTRTPDVPLNDCAVIMADVQVAARRGECKRSGRHVVARVGGHELHRTDVPEKRLVLHTACRDKATLHREHGACVELACGCELVRLFAGSDVPQTNRLVARASSEEFVSRVTGRKAQALRILLVAAEAGDGGGLLNIKVAGVGIATGAEVFVSVVRKAQGGDVAIVLNDLLFLLEFATLDRPHRSCIVHPT